MQGQALTDPSWQLEVPTGTESRWARRPLDVMLGEEEGEIGGRRSWLTWDPTYGAHIVIGTAPIRAWRVGPPAAAAGSGWTATAGIAEREVVHLTMRALYEKLIAEKLLEFERTISQQREQHSASLKQQKEYYEALIDEIERFRRTEFNLLLFGALASGLVILVISLIARL